MKKLLFIPLYLLAAVGMPLHAKVLYEGCRFQGDLPVNEVYKSVPKGLGKETLLVPMYDIVPKDVPNANSINDNVEIGNREIKKVMRGYDGKMKMVSLKDIEGLKAQGHRYLLDMVVMPKQFKEPKKEAMVSVYRKFKTANAMFANHDAQFHYYFYIRDLQTDDAYISKRFHGRFFAYQSMDEFIQQVNREM